MQIFSNNYRALAKPVLVVGLVLGAFMYGVGVGFYEWVPFAPMQRVRHALRTFWLGGHPPYQGERGILLHAFPDPLIRSELLYPPIRTFDELYRRNESLWLPMDRFFDAYENLSLQSVRSIMLDEGGTQVTAVVYSLGDRSYEAHAYGPLEPNRDARSAVLIIPGTGHNQSSAIYRRDPENYHAGIVELFEDRFDVYIFIKPNEDILAFHDGNGKLCSLGYVNWHLNRGGSYSAAYIVQSLALVKYMRTHYDEVAVAGLSQGGGAALLNALQSEPDIAIIASGYSSLTEKIQRSNELQLIIPGMDRVYPPSAIAEHLRSTPTRFLFSYGTDDLGIYRMEAYGRYTRRLFHELGVYFPDVVFEGGHIFPVEEIRSFLDQPQPQ